MLFHFAQPVIAQGFTSISGYVTVTPLGSSLPVRLDGPITLSEPIARDSVAVSVDGDSLYVVKGNRLFQIQKESLSVTRTLELPAK
jgi:hypothetical protein